MGSVGRSLTVTVRIENKDTKLPPCRMWIKVAFCEKKCTGVIYVKTQFFPTVCNSFIFNINLSVIL